MGPQDTTSNPNSSILHHFIISSDPINSQPHFEAQNFNHFEALGVFPTIQSLGERISRSVNLVQADEPDMGHNSRHVMNVLGAPNGASNHARRLSLSLGYQGLAPALHYKQSYLVSVTTETCSSESNGYMEGECSFMSNDALVPTEPSPSYSRFLRTAQLLLEEIADVGGIAVESSDLKRLFYSGSRGPTSSELKADLLSFTGSSSIEKHEVLIKITKLIALLEQVESRYEEYCNRMEEVVSSFEVIAGEGAAKTYTGLALQAMCRHFCSLRESILTQIKVARKKLCPELHKIKGVVSQLSLFDRETRQGRMSLQQLGLMQHCQRQAWRPLRGLPETSVAILRAWLFEHFLHPYPNDSEKLILASETGLTKNQVSNWFINARVRLWKPMIEEMYKEEFGESSSGDSDPMFTSSCGSTGMVSQILL